MKTISSIILTIVTFLLTIFPSSQSLLSYYQENVNNSNNEYEMIVSAFQKESVSELQALMCQNIKDNVDNLPEEIQKLYDAIEGENAEFSRRSIGGGDCHVTTDKGTISQIGIDIVVTTTTNKYVIGIWWESVNTVNPEEMGIRSIAISKLDPLESIHGIKATGNLSGWHD